MAPKGRITIAPLALKVSSYRLHRKARSDLPSQPVSALWSQYFFATFKSPDSRSQARWLLLKTRNVSIGLLWAPNSCFMVTSLQICFPSKMVRPSPAPRITINFTFQISVCSIDRRGGAA